MKSIFIGNIFYDSNIKSKIYNPYNNEVIEEISLADEKQAKQSLIMARKALIVLKSEENFEKKRRLLKLSLEIAKEKEEFAQLIMSETGKPIKLARIEVDRTVQILNSTAEEVDRIKFEYLDISNKYIKNTSMLTKKVPIGVIYAISPFNFPLNLIIHKLAPALALNCPIIIKPPKQSPLTAIKLAKIIEFLNFPQGLVQILPSDEKIAKIILESDDVNLVSFTGSEESGNAIKKIAYKKKTVFELGGIATSIIDKSANLKLAARKSALSAFAFSGQICIALQRLIIHEDIFEEFKKLLIEESKKIKYLNPNDENALIGPMIDGDAIKKFHRFYHDAIVKRANIILEPVFNENIISPAIIQSEEDNLLLNKEEAFAPILLIRKYKDIDYAINWANNTRYGLQASIFSDSYKNINKAIDNLDFGGVVINDSPSFRIDTQAYGGLKASGHSREGVKYAMEEFLVTKTIIYRN